MLPTENTPFSVSDLASTIKEHINALSYVWVEGELAGLSIRAGHAYAKLKDLNKDAVISIVIWSSVYIKLDTKFQNGDRVIIGGKLNYWEKGGTLTLQVSVIKQAGIGNLLAQLELLRQKLAAEGLFEQKYKKPIPYLPKCIGLITGKNSDAEKDILQNVYLRWKHARFKTIHTRVQGQGTEAEVISALKQLDADEGVDVIIIARGGGDFLHLLPFSSEDLVRAAFAASTPIISAIGHENDRPLLDFVADVRASTPTDAAKIVVPNAQEEELSIANLQSRSTAWLTRYLESCQNTLAMLRTRPCIIDPFFPIKRLEEELFHLSVKLYEIVTSSIRQQESDLQVLQKGLNSLSPSKTLQRGYAIVQTDANTVVQQAEDLKHGQVVRVLLFRGRVRARIIKDKDT